MLVVGEPGAPPKKTPDTDVYRTAIALGRTLISRDLSTMLVTVTSDLKTGGHNCGAIFLKPEYPVARYGSDIHLIWFCETSDDWIDRIDFIPY
jgi:hypothetical protein